VELHEKNKREGKSTTNGHRVSFSDDMVVVPTNIHENFNNNDYDVDKKEDVHHNDIEIELEIDIENDIENNKNDISMSSNASSNSSSDEEFDSPLLSFNRRLSAELISRDGSGRQITTVFDNDNDDRNDVMNDVGTGVVDQDSDEGKGLNFP